MFKRIDSCAAEFRAATAYMYSTYEEECESAPTGRPKIMVLGSGPNRIGQGIEFDYCCVQASLAMREAGYESIMVNCNPETVSTDYDTSDRLYFEPLALENVLEIIRVERPDGIIVQYGGQTPLKLARAPRGRRRRDQGHASRQHRPGGRSRAIPATSRCVQSASAPQSDRPHPGRRRGARGRDRLSARRAPFLRARRTGDEDRVRRGGSLAVHA